MIFKRQRVKHAATINGTGRHMRKGLLQGNSDYIWYKKVHSGSRDQTT